MDPDKDNANPTILNASDLPSRRGADVVKPREDGGTGLFDGLVPFGLDNLDPYQSSTSSSDDDLDRFEDIDEQEVYGG